MKTYTCAVYAAALLSTSVSAFRDSSPLLIWSSKAKESLRDAQEAMTSGVIAADEIYRTLPTLGCDWERVAVVHVNELHQSHLPGLKIAPAPADLHIPYLINPSESTLSGALQEWAQICGAELVSHADAGVSREGKTIARIESDKEGAALPELSSADITILTGLRAGSKRQEPADPQRPNPTHTSTASHATSTATHRPTGHSNSSIPSPDAPLLDRYQLLSTPIITALLISLLIFVPVVMFGVSALAGIQVPPRMMEIGKGMTVGKEKKDQ